MDKFGLVLIYRQLPFLLFLLILGLIYIMMALKMEQKRRYITELKAEVKEERSKFYSLQSEYMFKSTRSEVEKKVLKKGLMNDPSNVYVIKVNSDEAED